MNGSLRAQCIAEFFRHRAVSVFWYLLPERPETDRRQPGAVGDLYYLGTRYFSGGVPDGRHFGGHLNPAVTVALWLFACFPGRKVVPYIVAQVAGAFGGAVLAWILYSTLFTQFETVHHMVRGSWKACSWPVLFSTYPAPELSIWHAALVEVVITLDADGDDHAALTDDGNGVPRGPLAPLLIGILVAVIGASTGPLTGFAMNPARDFGPEIVHLVRRVGQYRHDRGRDIPYFIVPIIAPLLGACLGAAIYRFLIANNLPCHTCVEGRKYALARHRGMYL